MKLTGAEIIIRELIEQGVTDVFGYPGGQILTVYDALYKYRDKCTYNYKCPRQSGIHYTLGDELHKCSLWCSEFS